MRKWTILPLVVLLAECKPAAEKVPGDAEPTTLPAPEAKADGPTTTTTVVNLDGEGLRFIDTESGKASLLAFGALRAQVEEALADVAGAPDGRSANQECGAGPMEFTNYGPMTLNFQGGKFVGWFLGDKPGASAYATTSGISIGTTRAKAKESVVIADLEHSTLGEEFRIGTGDNVIGGMFAKPGDAAKIGALFAGMNCFFR